MSRSPTSWSVVTRTSSRLISFLSDSSFELMNRTLSSTSDFSHVGNVQHQPPCAEQGVLEHVWNLLVELQVHGRESFQVAQGAVVVEDLVGQHLPVVEPSSDVNERQQNQHHQKVNEVKAGVGEGVDRLEHSVNGSHQVEIEVRPQPEHEKEPEERQQDHADKLEPGEIKSHHQEVESKDGQEEHP